MATASSKSAAQLDYERDRVWDFELDERCEKLLELLRAALRQVNYTAPDKPKIRRSLTEAALEIKRLCGDLQEVNDKVETEAERKLEARLGKLVDFVLDVERRTKTGRELIAYVHETYPNGELPE